VARDGEEFKTERAALGQARLRFNGEVELGKRQIQDGWDELHRAQREWQASRQAEDSQLARKRLELSEGLASLSAAQRVLAAQDAQARASRTLLQKEVHGLENRIRNLRHKLAEHERELARKQGRPELALAPRGLIIAPAPVNAAADCPNSSSSPED